MGIEGNIRHKLWCEKARDAQYWDNAISRNGIMTNYNLFHGMDPPGVRYGRKFGEMAVVAYHANRIIRSKLSAHGRVCMYLGPSEDNAEDAYRFITMDTKKVILSRDV